MAVTPRPAFSWKSSIDCPENAPLSRAFRTIAAARGCPDRDSIVPARSSTSCSLMQPKGRTSVTSGRPMVKVPVLSKATTFTRSTSSR